MLTRLSLIVAALVFSLSAMAAATFEPVPEIAPGKNWDTFKILVWQYQTNAAKDKALYESVNLHGFHIDRKDDALAAFGKENNWPFYVDHAAGKGYLHIPDKLSAQVTKKLDIVARPNSLTDPKTIQAMKDLLKDNITSAKGSTPVAYAFDDEISMGWFASPVETDGTPAAIDYYRKDLERQYGSIDKLNAEYGSSYKDFASIQPKSFEAFRGALKPNNLASFNLAMWCDWREGMDDLWMDTIADLTRYANSLDNATPAGFVGGHTPSAWGGADYRKLTKAIQWMEAYDIGGTNEILRSFWNQKHAHVQTFFSSKDPHQDSWFIWYYLCHGNRGLIGWPEGWFKDGKVAEYITKLAPTFKEVQGPVSQKIIDGTFVHDPIAIYYSQPSIRVTWAMDAVTHGKTWPNRSSSMDNGLSTSALTRIGWLKTLEDIGLQARFIHQDHLLDGVLLKDGYKVLILNHALCLSDAEAAAIKAFSDKGGVVIADHLCGVFDEHGKARSSGALDGIFGVKHDLDKGILNGNTLTEADGEKGGSFSEKTWVSANVPVYKDLLVYERGLSAAGGGKADSDNAVIRNGKNVYLNLSTAGYLLKRPKDEAKEWLALAADIFTKAGVTPRVRTQLDGKPGVHMEEIFWRNGNRTTLCVLKNIDRKATIDSFGATAGGLGDGSVKLKLSFATPVKGLKNERTGKDLGDGKEFEDDFTPWEANVYTYE